MRTQTELPPLTLAEFNAEIGYLEQGTPGSWERLVQSEMTLRGRTAQALVTRVTMGGAILWSLSALTLFLAQVYRYLGGALIGYVGPNPFQNWLIAGMAAGLAICIGGLWAPRVARRRHRWSHHRDG